MLPLLYPPPLRPNQKVAVVSLSWHGPAALPRETQRGLSVLAGLGFDPFLMPHASGTRGWTSGTPRERAADLHKAIEDPEVGLVLCSIGGDHSSQVLEFLDFALIGACPKLICGYSDGTVILNAVHAMTGLITLYGPALIPQFGEYPAPYSGTIRHFMSVVSGETLGELPRFEFEVSDQDFQRRELELRARDRAQARPRRVLRDGEARGRLIAGCLPSIRHLIGTAWAPSLSDSVLFLETPGHGYRPQDADADLWHLRNAGLLDGVLGLVIGRPLGWSRADRHEFDGVLQDVMAGRAVPIVLDVEFGHTDPMVTLPMGVPVEVKGDHIIVNGRATLAR